MDNSLVDSFNQKLKDINACPEALEFCKGKTLQDAWEQCDRGDWMLWLYEMASNFDIYKLHLAKGYCAETVIHLMKDEKSKNAVKAAVDFGNGRITIDELSAACDASASAYAACASASAYAASAYAAYAASASAYAASASTYAASAAYAASASAYAACASASAYAASASAAAYATAAYAAYAAAAYAAKKQNQKLTADICRRYLPLPIL